MSSTVLYPLWMFLVGFFLGKIYLNKTLLQFQHQVFYFLVVLFFCLRFRKINFHILESSVLMVLIDPLVISINFYCFCPNSLKDFLFHQLCYFLLQLTVSRCFLFVFFPFKNILTLFSTNLNYISELSDC